MFINFAFSKLATVFELVVKSEYLVPIPIMTSASFAYKLAAKFPVTPRPPRFSG